MPSPLTRTAFSLGHAGIIYAVAISPDSRHSISASGDGLIRLWDNLSGHCLKVFEGHTGGVLCVRISHDGIHALSGSEDKTIRLWNISTGECEQIFTGHPDPVTTVAFSPDDRQIVTVSTRTEDPKTADPDPAADPASGFDSSLQTLRIWDRHPAKLRHERTTPTTYDERIDISPDTRHALFIPKDDYVPHVFDISTANIVSAFRELGGDEDNAVQTCHAWSPDSQRILSGLNTGLIQLWNAKTGKGIRNLNGHNVEVNAIAFSPDGRYAISAADNQELRIWDISTGRCLYSMEGHEERIAAVAWAPNNRFALSGAFDHQLFQWDTTDGSLIEIFEGHTSYWINNVQWNKDCRLALSCASDKTIRLWDTQTGYQLHTFRGHTDLTHMAVWNPTNDQAASISKDGTIRIWEVMTGRLLHSFPPYIVKKLVLIPNCIAWSPDGTTLVIGFDNGSLLLRPIQQPDSTPGADSNAGSPGADAHDAEVSDIAWSPDSRFFASASYDNTARISSSEGITLRILKGPDNRVQCLSWSPDSEYLACGYIDDSAVRIWECSTGRCVSILKGHSGGVRRVAWSPDGRFILSGSEDHTLRIWEVNTKSCLRVLEGNTDHVVGISWSPDMNAVYSATANGVCAKWTL